MAKSDLDCRNVLENIKSVEGKRAFVVFWRLSQWASECLSRKMNNPVEFPVDQEELLRKNIEFRVKDLKPGLILFDIKDLKRLGRILQEYLPGTDPAFNKNLILSLQNACQSIYKKLKNIEKERKETPLVTEWQDNVDAAPDSLVSYDPHLDNPMEEFLNLQMDVESLLKIKTQINEFYKGFDRYNFDVDPAEYDLALQRVFHVAGEYLKSTSLSEGTRESLNGKGVPIKALSKFRDDLAHQTLFPLVGTEWRDRYKLESAWRTVQWLLENEIAELEGNYLYDIIIQNTDAAKRSEVEKLLGECEFKTVYCLEKKVHEKRITEENPWEAETLAELDLQVVRMKSRSSPEWAASKEQLSRSIKNDFADFIIKRKKSVYDKIYDNMRGSLENIGSYKVHQNDMKIMEMSYILSYGGTVDKEGFEKFVRELPNDVYVKLPAKGNEEVNVKEEFKKYFDLNEVKNGWEWETVSHEKLNQLAFEVSDYGYGQTVEGMKVVEYLTQLNQGSIGSITPENYEEAVSKLAYMPAETLEGFYEISIGWKKKECVKLLRNYLSDLLPLYDKILDPKGKPAKKRVQKMYNELVPAAAELYNARVKSAIEIAVPLENPSAVESQVFNVAELLEKSEALEVQKKERQGPRNPDPKRGWSSQEIDGTKDDIHKFRNYLGHGDVLASSEKEAEMARELVRLKDDLKVPLLKAAEEGNIDFDGVSELVSRMYPTLAIKNILCPGSGQSDSGPLDKRRKGREVADCLEWEDIERVAESEEGWIDRDNIKIDSEKMMKVLENEVHLNEEKFAKYVALSENSEIMGRSSSDIVRVFRQKKTYVRHLENVEKFSGVVVHAMMAKNILGDALEGNYEGVAINVGFIGSGYLLEGLSKIAAKNGATFAKEGRLFLGGSLKLSSPLLSRGLSLFIAYDLYEQIQAYKAGNRDAIVGIVGDGALLTTEVVEGGIVFAEWLGVIGGVSTVTGPIGAAIGATVFVGTEIYNAVKQVEKIDKSLHLDRLERFNEGLRGFIGVGPSKLITNELEVKQGNTALVENAKKILSSNRNIQKYVFPSFIQIGCYNPFIALNSTVRLASKVNLNEWARTSPDEVPEVNVFCKPKGSGEPVPDGWGYYCDNAIGVEYTKDRTSDYTLIQMGKGDAYVEGFRDSGNIFIVDSHNKTLIGGSKDDSFRFHLDPNPVQIEKQDSCMDPIFKMPAIGFVDLLVKRQGMKMYQQMLDLKVDIPGSEMVGSIDGGEGLDTIDVQGMRNTTDSPYKTVVADFPGASLRYGDLVVFNVTNVEIFFGSTMKPDRVVAACNMSTIDGRGGYSEQHQDVIYIPKASCSYNTTVVVGPYTNATNDALTGHFQYFIQGNASTTSDINLQNTSKTKDEFIFQYGIHDLASIKDSVDKIKFCFVKEFYGGMDTIQWNNSFNMTVSKHNGNSYLLTDNTQIVVGERTVYAMQNTDRSIDSIAEVYKELMANLNGYLVVRSKNEVLTITGPLNEVLTNDPSSTTTHFVSGSGENVFKLVSGLDGCFQDCYSKLPINEVVIHYFTPEGAVDTLDVRQIQQQLYDGLNMKLLFTVSRVSDDLKIHLFVYTRNGSGGTKTVEFLKITLRNVLKYVWFKKIQLVMDTIFSLEESAGDFKFFPQTMVLDNPDDTVFVINPTDVTTGSRIKISKKLRSYIFARKGDALIITNALNDDSHIHPLATVVVNGFYHSYMTCNHETGTYGCPRYKYDGKMASLIIEFDDKTIELSQDMEGPGSAGDFVKMKEKVESESYRKLLEAIRINRALFGNMSKENVIKHREFISHNQWVNPLSHAAIEGINKPVKDLIVSGGAQVTLKDANGHSPFYYAVKYGREAMASDFYNHFKDMLMHGGKYKQLMVNITSELPVVEYIIGKDEASDLRSGFGRDLAHSAFIGGNLDVVKYLIQKVEGDQWMRDEKAGFLADSMDAVVTYNHSSVFDYLVQTIRAKGIVPLSFTIKYGTEKVEKFLLENKRADIYEKDKDGRTPLFYAFDKSERLGAVGSRDNLIRTIRMEGDGQVFAYPIITGDMNVMQSLMEMTDMKELVNEKNYLGSTPLHYAAIYGSLEMARMLVNGGARPSLDLKDDSSQTPVDRAIENQHASVLVYFYNGDKSKAMVRAVLAGKARLTKELSEGGADLNQILNNGDTFLHYAAGGESVELVRYLLEKGLSPNARNHQRETPLYIASRAGNLDMVKTLAKADAHATDGNYQEPLAVALKNDHTQVIIYLCEVTGRDPLLLASEAGKVSTVKYLVQNGADIHKTDSKKQSLLHLAVMSGNLALVTYLVEGGISPNVKNGKDQTPLHYVAIYGRPDIGRYLIGKGADVNSQDELWWTPIFWTINKYDDNVKMLQLFISNGADLRARDKLGRTPLSMAQGHDPHSRFTNYIKKKLDSGRGKRRKRRQIDPDQEVSQLGRSVATSGNSLLETNNRTLPAAASSTRSDLGFLKWANNLLHHKAENFTTNELTQIDAQIDSTGALMLVDLLIRKITGRKYVGTTADEGPLEIQARALNIVRAFEETLNEAEDEFGVDGRDFYFDPVELQSVVIGQLRSGRSSEIPKTMEGFAKKTCAKSGQCEKIMGYIMSRLVLGDSTQQPEK